MYPSALEATKDIKSEQTLTIGGFGICGIPEDLIGALVQHNPRDLTIVSNNCGIETAGTGLMLNNK